MSGVSLKRDYDAVAQTYAKVLPDLSFEAPLDRAVIDHFARAAGETPKILDAGCGAGRLAAHLADQGCDVTGADLSAEMIRAARRDHPGLHFDVADIAELPYPDASFDGVVAWYSLIHTPLSALPGVVAELARVLVPGGVLLVAAHLGAGTRSTNRAYGHDVQLDLVLHELDGLGRAVEDAGLSREVVLERAPREGERSPQGFVIGRARGGVLSKQA